MYTKLYRSFTEASKLCRLPMSITTSRSPTATRSRGYFRLYARKGTSGQKLLFVFVDRKVPYDPAARPESLLRSVGKKTCDIFPSDRLDRRLGQLQASIFPALSIGSIPNSIVRKGRTLGDHRPDIEFIVQSLVHARTRRVQIRPP